MHGQWPDSEWCLPQLNLVFEDRPVDAAYKGGGAGYHSRILKETEKASPGYCSVYLYDHDVFAEMTVTTRCGFQKYTFPEKKGIKGSYRSAYPCWIQVFNKGCRNKKSEWYWDRRLCKMPDRWRYLEWIILHHCEVIKLTDSSYWMKNRKTIFNNKEN